MARIQIKVDEITCLWAFRKESMQSNLNELCGRGGDTDGDGKEGETCQVENKPKVKQ